MVARSLTAVNEPTHAPLHLPLSSLSPTGTTIAWSGALAICQFLSTAGCRSEVDDDGIGGSWQKSPQKMSCMPPKGAAVGRVGKSRFSRILRFFIFALVVVRTGDFKNQTEQNQTGVRQTGGVC